MISLLNGLLSSDASSLPWFFAILVALTGLIGLWVFRHKITELIRVRMEGDVEKTLSAHASDLQSLKRHDDQNQKHITELRQWHFEFVHKTDKRIEQLQRERSEDRVKQEKLSGDLRVAIAEIKYTKETVDGLCERFDEYRAENKEQLNRIVTALLDPPKPKTPDPFVRKDK